MSGGELDLERILGRGPEPTGEGHRSGFVALAGRPNVGKSTLVNAIVGSKVAIVTDVPGTTRNVIRGVLTRDDLQLVFVDTPGFIKPRTLLNRRLNELIEDALGGVDVVCFVVDAAAGIGAGDEYVASVLAETDLPVVCVVNKEDRFGDKHRLIPVLDRASELGEFAEIVPTSATTGMNVDRLVDVLATYVPEGPRFFSSATVSDQPERQLIAEIIREKFITRVMEEVPHSIAVVVDDVEDEAPAGADASDEEAAPTLTRIQASIFVERDSQKGIVIGKGGHLIKDANTRARQELERILGTKVFLDVRVKVAKDWQRDPKQLGRFGY